jgi:hypothetical protein
VGRPASSVNWLSTPKGLFRRMIGDATDSPNEVPEEGGGDAILRRRGHASGPVVSCPSFREQFMAYKHIKVPARARRSRSMQTTRSTSLTIRSFPSSKAMALASTSPLP